MRPGLTLSGTGAVVASSSATGWSPLRSSLTSSTIFGCAFPGCALRFFQAELSPRFALTAVRLPAGTGRPTKVRSNVRRDLSGWILTERACVDAPPRLCPRRASEAALTGPRIDRPAKYRRKYSDDSVRSRTVGRKTWFDRRVITAPIKSTRVIDGLIHLKAPTDRRSVSRVSPQTPRRSRRPRRNQDARRALCHGCVARGAGPGGKIRTLATLTNLSEGEDPDDPEGGEPRGRDGH